MSFFVYSCRFKAIYWARNGQKVQGIKSAFGARGNEVVDLKSTLALWIFKLRRVGLW